MNDILLGLLNGIGVKSFVDFDIQATQGENPNSDKKRVHMNLGMGLARAHYVKLKLKSI